MDCASEEAVRPVGQEITDVDEDRGAGVILSSRWRHRYGSPAVVTLEDLEASLALETEEQRYGAIVRMCAGPHVLIAVGSALGSRVAEEAEDRAGCPV